MIKLQTDFDLSTIIEKRAYVRGANILGGRCPGGGKCPGGKYLGRGPCDRNPFISLSVVVSLIFRQIYSKV